MKDKLRVFEAFAGIGAQSSALKRLNINYEIVGISEWFIEAILCYDQIQNDGKPEIELPTLEEQIQYLKQFTFSKDSVHPIEDISNYQKNYCLNYIKQILEQKTMDLLLILVMV